MKKPQLLTLIGIGVASAMMVSALPAAAQDSSEDEITVIGNYGKVPDDTQSLSQAVSYADLDLSTDYGWNELKTRIRLTARFLCDKLGEPDFASPPVPSCRDAATRDAMQRLGTNKALRAPRGTTWVAAAPWHAPYPGEWVGQGY